MDSPNSISIEARLENDGELKLTGLPYRAGDQLVVQIEPAPSNGSRRFPMRGKPYQYSDPFAPAAALDDWDAQR
jgi:hypothetical protein